MKKKLRIIFALVAFLAILASFCAGCASKNALASPTGFTVSDDYLLAWTDVLSARGYEVRVNQLDGTHVTTESSKRASASLAFLDEGDYLIAVRAIGDGSKYTNSGWSEEFDFRKNYESGCIYKLINNNSEYEISRAGAATDEVMIEDYYRDKPVTSIGTSAFRQSVKLTKIIVGDKVESIGDNAFYHCSNLEEVIIPQSVKHIGDSAFQSCDKIKSITLPDMVEKISDFAFAYCSGLTSIDLSHVKTIGESAFSNCIGLQSIVIPDGVTSISYSSFYRCISAETLTIGNGIEFIPSEAFAMCESLETVNFGDGKNLKWLDGQCFKGCVSLEEIDLPDGLESLGDLVFKDCDKLYDITIPESVTDIGSGSFDGTKIYNDTISGGGKMVYVGNWLVASTNDALLGVAKLSADNLKPGVVGIAGSVFKDRESRNNASWSFDIPASLKYICSYAFSNTKVWRLVSGNGSRLQRIGVGAFDGCELLSNIILADGLKVIDRYAFNGCKILNNSTQFSIIPSTVERVGAYAFRDTALYGNPDAYGVVYAGIVGEESWVVDYVINESNPITSVDLKSTVYGIADQAFYRCSEIKSIMGLNRASIVGKYAFAYCTSLMAVSLNPNIDTIKTGTFLACTSLTDVSLPTRIKTIEAYAFGYCSKLVQIRNIAANSLTSIGYAAFAYCISFTGENNELHFGANFKEMGEYAFFDCESLETVTIPDGLKVISAHAFSHCYGLRYVDFGNGVEEIGDYAFYLGTEEEEDDQDQNDEETDDVATDEDVEHTEIPERTTGFSIELPASVKKIGSYAFYGCGITLGQDSISGEMPVEPFVLNLGAVEEIGEFAFSTGKIGDLILPDSLKTVGKYAFYKCEINSVTIGEGLEDIGRHAFNGCSQVTFYCERENRLESWDVRWNSSYIPVVWGCKLSDEGYVESVTITSSTLSHGLNGVAAPVRQGYDFVGWSLASGSETAVYTAEGFAYIPVGTTVYAVWRSTSS